MIFWALMGWKSNKSIHAGNSTPTNPGEFLAPSFKPLLCWALVLGGCRTGHFLPGILFSFRGKDRALSVPTSHPRMQDGKQQLGLVTGCSLRPSQAVCFSVSPWPVTTYILRTRLRAALAFAVCHSNRLAARNGCGIHALDRHDVDRPGRNFSTLATVPQR